jgi:hypothetical protein
MNELETAMGVAMALKYLREKVRERNQHKGMLTRQTIVQLSTQIVGRLLMTIGMEMQITGKRLITVGQSEAGC